MKHESVEFPVGEIHRRILDIEEAHDIFEQKVGGLYFYERFRYSTHKKIYAKTGVSLKSYDPRKIGAKTSTETGTERLTEYATAVYRALRSLGKKNPYLAGDPSYLIFGTSRKFKTPDGQWADKVLDPIMDELPASHLLLERSDHDRPLQTDDVAYLDFPWYVGHIPGELGAPHISLTGEERRTIREFEQAIETEFDIQFDLLGRVKRHLARRQVRLPLFRRLIRQTDPELVIMRGAFGEMKSTFLEACHANDVEVVDCQFRSLNKNEGHYHYPGDRRKRVKADYFLSWGEFWTDSIELPFDDDSVFSVGYPYIEDQYNQYNDESTDIDLLFVSSLSCGTDLSKFAVEFIEQVDEDLNVVYKLHPGEFDKWTEWYSWLTDVDITVIDDQSISLYELFAKSRAQVGVTSTALYEGMRFGLETYLVDGQPGLFEMKGLLDEDFATLVDTPADLSERFDDSECYNPHEGFDIEKLFEPNPRANFKAVFEHELT